MLYYAYMLILILYTSFWAALCSIWTDDDLKTEQVAISVAIILETPIKLLELIQ